MPGLDNGVLLVLFGVICIALGFYELVRARKSRRWRAVDGNIIDSQVVNRGSSFLPTWEAKVSYRYSVGSVQYQGSRISLTRVGDGDVRWLAADQAKKYPPGRKVKVYVSPEDPSMAVLEPKEPLSVYATLIVGVLFAAYGIYEMAR